MPNDPDDPDDPDVEKTPLPPAAVRRHTSKSMRAIGLQTCPACRGDMRVDCDLCFDPETETFLRKVTVDEAIAWNQRQHEEK